MFAKNIKYLREMNRMQQNDLSKRLGYKSAAVISIWEAGKSKPRPEQLQKIAKLFNVSVDDLLYVDLENRSPVEMPAADSVRINVYSSVHAGIPSLMTAEVESWEDIPKAWTTGGRRYFGVKVKGDCMSPKYLEGDTVIVREESDCESGTDVIAAINGDDAILRQLDKIGTSIVLRPLNPAYPPYIYTGDASEDHVSILGVVVELRRSI